MTGTKPFTGLVLLLIAFLFPLIAQEAVPDTALLRRRAEKQFLHLERNQKIFRFNKDTTIPDSEVVNGHVVVINGDLDIWGQVNGDVVVIGGNVVVHNDAQIYGNITCLGGEIQVEEAGHVTGDMLETLPESILSLGENIHRSQFRTRWHTPSWVEYREEKNHPVFRYNRVEGPVIGWEIWHQPETLHHFNLDGFVGYGIKSRTWRFQVGLSRWFIDPDRFRLEIGTRFYDLTDTKDLWRIPYLENTLAALLFREDFHDYFRRRGYTIFLSQNFTTHLNIQLAYHDDTFESLPVVTNWSLFGGKKNFRPNPSLGPYEGTYKSLVGSLRIKFLSFRDYPKKGWDMRVMTEVAPGQWNTQPAYQRYWWESRFYFTLSPHERLNLRLAAGTSVGDLPIQKNFELGGISTLRGYPYKAFQGNHMVLGNIEYALMPGIMDFLFLEDMSFILFYDVGQAWPGNPDLSLADNWRYLSRNRLHSDVGIAIADEDGDFRINIARPIGRENKFVVTFRLNWPF